ncbi:MAG: hypothetical protein ACOVLB_05025 [Candidatus Nanopelagicus sp.]
MAGKAKSVYLTVSPKGKLQSVLNKVFFNAKDLDAFIKTDEFKEKYPEDQFTIFKETY